MSDNYSAKVGDAIRAVVASWPPLTPDQMARLAGLFRAGGDEK
jgi:hypothetical protein